MTTLEIDQVSKRYGGVQALKDASLELRSGEVHGLLGPNGSGKSTLNKVLSGAVRPDQARIRIDGTEVSIDRPLDAQRHGIASVYQHLSLVPHLTVAENLVLGTEATSAGFLAPRRQRRRIDEVLERLAPGLGPKIRPDTRASRLSPGQSQIVELGKAWLRDPRFLVLDEATASLHRDQVELLFSVVRELTADGVGVVFVSHRMEEVMALCQRATVLRNGLNIATVELAETTDKELVRLMVGDELASRVGSAAETNRQDGEAPVVETTDLVAPGVDRISLAVRPGEVLGLGGLQGQGQSELLLSLFGANPATAGTVTIGGRRRHLRTPRAGIRAGVALVPGDRGADGLYDKRSIQENISTVSLPSRTVLGAISMRKERAVARDQVRSMSIKIGSLDHPVSSLSGGNQQKVVIGKWLPARPRVVLLDDPTKGVDVGAKAEIYTIIRELTADGVAVILNSSDDTELEELADRVLVLFEGAVVNELEGDEITHSALEQDEQLADRVLVLFEGAVVNELEGDEITHSALVASALLVDDDEEAMPA